VVLASSSRNGTSELSNACKDREVAKPDKCEAVDETGRSSTVEVRYKVLDSRYHNNSLLEPDREDAATVSGSRARLQLKLTLIDFPRYTSDRTKVPSCSQVQSDATAVSQRYDTGRHYKPSTPVSFPLLLAHNDHDRSLDLSTPISSPCLWPEEHPRSLLASRYLSP
jgi:hypothetical protein